MSSVLKYGIRLFLTLALAVLPASGAVYLAAGSQVADAAENWKDEYDDICSKAADPMSLEPKELINLIARSEKLKLWIETLEGSERKVYLRKLIACRDLFRFVLESREKNGSQPN